jgi:hypothetical protein
MTMMEEKMRMRISIKMETIRTFRIMMVEEGNKIREDKQISSY